MSGLVLIEVKPSISKQTPNYIELWFAVMCETTTHAILIGLPTRDCK